MIEPARGKSFRRLGKARSNARDARIADGQNAWDGSRPVEVAISESCAALRRHEDQDDLHDPAATRRDFLLAAYLERRADLVRFLTARLGSAAAAEDIVQDLYIRLATLEPAVTVENPSAFLYRAAINLMLDRHRGDRRSERRDQDWQAARGVTIGAVATIDEPSPEDAASARQRLRLLVEAVEALPPKTREAFKLHKFEGLSQVEAAARLGVTRKTVEKQLAAALKQLVLKLGGRV